MSCINKEILEERIRENSLEFIELVPEAYNIAVSYLEHKIEFKKKMLLNNVDILDIDPLEESCALFIEAIHKKIVP